MPLTIYVSAPFALASGAHEVACSLRAAGHLVSSTWHSNAGADDGRLSSAQRRSLAIRATEELIAADVLLLLPDLPQGARRGGRLVEFGIALAMGLRLIVVGSRETVFHHLTDVNLYPTPEDAIEALQPEAPAAKPLPLDPAFQLQP